jgi:hypothetical protein
MVNRKKHNILHSKLRLCNGVSVASVSENYKNLAKSAGLEQGGYIHRIIEYNLFLAWL